MYDLSQRKLLHICHKKQARRHLHRCLCSKSWMTCQGECIRHANAGRRERTRKHPTCYTMRCAGPYVQEIHVNIMSTANSRRCSTLLHGCPQYCILICLCYRTANSRFIVNLPDEELESIERICFSIEQAHWFYEDFVRPQASHLPSLSLRKFSELVFQSCPLLR